MESSNMITGNEKKSTTKDKYSAAIKVWDTFAAKENYSSFEDISEEEFCDRTKMNKFAYYLVYVYTKMSGGEEITLMKNTVLGYLSAIMNAARDKFTTDRDGPPSFFEVLGGKNSSVRSGENWYTKMNEGVAKGIVSRAIESGEQVEKDGPGLPKSILAQMCLALFAVGSNAAMYRRFALVMLWMGLGRVGEVVTTTWKLCSWCFLTGMLYMNWSMTKTNKQKGLLFPPDKGNLLISYC
jgi:hypothetical protein